MVAWGNIYSCIRKAQDIGKKIALRLILFLSRFECFRDAEMRTYHGIKFTTLTWVYERFYGDTLVDISVFFFSCLNCVFFPSELCSFEKQRTISAACVSWFAYFTSKHISFHRFATSTRRKRNEVSSKVKGIHAKNFSQMLFKSNAFFQEIICLK